MSHNVYKITLHHICYKRRKIIVVLFTTKQAFFLTLRHNGHIMKTVSKDITKQLAKATATKQPKDTASNKKKGHNKMTMLENYNVIISDLAERASDYIKDGEEDESEAINQAIDDGLIYYEDQATIIGGYIMTYCPRWGEDIDWEEVYEMLYDDISEELQNIKENEA